MILFRECDWRGRRLLFDSSAFEVAGTQQSNQPNTGNSNTIKPPLKHEKNQHNVEYFDGVSYKVAFFMKLFKIDLFKSNFNFSMAAQLQITIV